MDFKRKSIVITGATSGIGFKLLKYFIGRGDCRVCAVGRSERKLNRLKEIFGEKIYCVKCDVGIKTDVDAMFRDLFTKSDRWGGTVDIFIANAGFGFYEKIRSADWERMERVYSVNCFSPVYSLLKMKEYAGKRRFQFVLMSSAAAKIPLPGYALYSSAKAAADAFARAYAWEKDKNVILSVVYPVAVRTPFYKKGMKEPLFRQNLDTAVENIINGVYLDKKYICPSNAFKTYLFLRNMLPLTAVYSYIEKLRLNK